VETIKKWNLGRSGVLPTHIHYYLVMQQKSSHPLNSKPIVLPYSGHPVVGFGDLRQMSAYPIPHGWAISFLHPEEMEAS
jgi:hypothetical protein